MSDVPLQRLFVSLEGRFNNYERALARTQKSTTNGFAAMRRQGANFENSLSRIGAGLAGAFAGAGALRGAQQLIDASTRVENSLKVAGLEGQALGQVYDALFQSAQRNAAPLEALAQLYGRVALVQGELGTSTEEMLKFTDNVALALRVAGTDAQSASGALMQLSQAMGSGVVRAEEFNSILEGATPIAQAAAAGLTEAGGSVAKLRQLVVDGKVSSEAFFRAFEAGAGILESKVAGSEITVSSAFVRLQNVLIDAAGQFNKTSGAGQRFAGFLDTLGTKITELANSPSFDTALGELGDAISKTFEADLRDIQRVIALVEELKSKFDQYGDSVSDADLALAQAEQQLASFATNTAGRFGQIGVAAQDLFQQVLEGKGSAELAAEAIEALGDADPDFGSLLTEIGGVIQRIYELRAAAIAATRPDVSGLPMTYAGQERTPAKPVVKPVSLSDYDPPGGSGTGGGTGGGSAKISQIERERKAVEDLIDSLLFEQSTIGKTDAQKRAMELVRQAGAAATETEKAQILAIVDAIETEEGAIDRLKDAMASAQGIAQGFAGDLIAGFSAGKTWAENLDDAIGNLRNKLLAMAADMAIQALFSGVMGAFGGRLGTIGVGGVGVPSGGFIPGVTGPKLFDVGGYTGPGHRLKPAGIVHAGEVVWSQRDIRRAGGVARVESLRLGGYSNGGVVGTPSIPGASYRPKDIDGGRSGSLEVRIKNEGGQAIEAKSASMSNSGGVDIVDIVVGAFATGAAQGKTDGVMSGIYGVKRRGRG